MATMTEWFIAFKQREKKYILCSEKVGESFKMRKMLNF